MKNTILFKHLERSLDGQNQWWKYLLVLLLGFLVGQLLGSIPLVAVFVIVAIKNGGVDVDPANMMNFEAWGIDSNLGLFLMVIPFIVSLFFIILLVKAFHQRTYNEVINGRSKIRWKRMFGAFAVWAVLSTVLFVLDLLIDPDNFKLQFELASFLPLVFVCFLFIPLQAATEEFVFRGYLAQGFAGWTKNRIVAILVPSVFFALLHYANPEVKEFGFWLTMPQYFLFGVFFALISVLDDGIEIAIGLHAANNVFSGILVTHKSSVLQTSALYEQLEMDPMRDFIALFIICALVLIAFARYYKWDFSVLTRKVKLEQPLQEATEV